MHDGWTGNGIEFSVQSFRVGGGGITEHEF